MQLQWPWFLLLLVTLPLILAVYIWRLRRRARFAVRFSSLSLIRAALPRTSRWKRHVPFALFLLALASLIVAGSRPTATVQVPVGKATVMLTMDVSRSMLAPDIAPTRLEAAQAAAQSFIERQQSNTQIGLVAFAGFAELVQPPTDDQESLQIAIRSLTAGRGTAVGSGILESLDAIAGVNGSVAPSEPLQPGAAAPVATAAQAYVPDIIVVLTDGVSTTGPNPIDAAQQAVARGVRVYTIGFGTADGGLSFGGQPGGDLRGGGFRRGIDEATLQEVADMTGGAYYTAASASELVQVFQELPTYFSTKEESTEISVIFAAVGALLAATAIGISLLRYQLP